MTTVPTPPVRPTRAGRWATAAAATISARGWAACTAGCGWPVDPAADNGSGTHPGCDQRPQLTVIHGGTTR